MKKQDNDQLNADELLQQLQAVYLNGNEPSDDSAPEQTEQPSKPEKTDAPAKKPSQKKVSAPAAILALTENRMNSYISETKPWLLTGPEDAHRLDGLLATLLEAVRLMYTVAWPVMPDNSKRTFELLNCPEIRPRQKRFFRNGHCIGEPYIAFMRKAKAEKAKKD